MASTAIPAAKSALLATLKASSGLTDVLVTADAEPTRDAEYVWVGTAEAEREFKGLGHKPQAHLKELLTIYLEIKVIKGNKSALSSEERAFEIFDAVENAIRDDMRLDNSVLWSRISNINGKQLLLDSKRAFQILVKVQGEARI